jgi:hypothetical protein
MPQQAWWIFSPTMKVCWSFLLQLDLIYSHYGTQWSSWYNQQTAKIVQPAELSIRISNMTYLYKHENANNKNYDVRITLLLENFVDVLFKVSVNEEFSTAQIAIYFLWPFAHTKGEVLWSLIWKRSCPSLRKIKQTTLSIMKQLRGRPRTKTASGACWFDLIFNKWWPW